MNTYLRKVWRSKHSFSLWHDIKKRQEKAESDGSVFFHEQTSKRQKMESVNDDLCNFRLAVYHRNNQIRQWVASLVSRVNDLFLPACFQTPCRKKNKIKIWKCSILRPHLLWKLVFLFPLNACWSQIFFFPFCIQQLKCQDHASNFARDDVLSTRYYNLFNNIIMCDLKEHFCFQFTQIYSGPFFLSESGQFMFKGPDQSRCWWGI